jgi:hypothetical protein
MVTIGTMPASGSRLSCMLLIAPQDASVVTVVNAGVGDAEAYPSLPSMLPPACGAGAWSTWSAANAGLRCLSVTRP